MQINSFYHYSQIYIFFVSFITYLFISRKFVKCLPMKSTLGSVSVLFLRKCNFLHFLFYSHFRFIMKRSCRDIDAVESIYILNQVCISIVANKGHNIDCSYEFESV